MKRLCPQLLMVFMAWAIPAMAAEDAVELTKKEYYNRYPSLPASRKCTPGDVKNVWIETGAMPADLATKQRGDKPIKTYLYFSDQYNYFFRMPSILPVTKDMLEVGARVSKLQYIATDAGLVYVYNKGALQETFLCFISTGASPQYQPGTLMLALPLEKDKPQGVYFYAPFGT